MVDEPGDAVAVPGVDPDWLQAATGRMSVAVAKSATRIERRMVPP